MAARGNNKYKSYKYGNILFEKNEVIILTVTYSVNGKPISKDDLKNIQITRKDYIDYVEALKKGCKNFHKIQKP